MEGVIHPGLNEEYSYCANSTPKPTHYYQHAPILNINIEIHLTAKRVKDSTVPRRAA